jgi:signal transduction histidine kinase
VKVNDNIPFYTDSYRISVIVNNIVSNAIKYRDTKKNDSRLEVTADVTSNELSLIFRDNGIGIPEEYLPRIFEMFYRATERSEGAGLGLYIVRETVEKLYGTIAVESHVGEGTTFRVTLPNLQTLESELDGEDLQI